MTAAPRVDRSGVISIEPFFAEPSATRRAEPPPATRAAGRTPEDRPSPSSPAPRREAKTAPGSDHVTRTVVSLAPDQVRQLERSVSAELKAAVDEIAELKSIIATERKLTALRMYQLEREAMASVAEALRSTLAAERELAVVRTAWLEERLRLEHANTVGQSLTLQPTRGIWRRPAIARIAARAQRAEITSRLPAGSSGRRRRGIVVGVFALAAVLSVIGYDRGGLWLAGAPRRSTGAVAAVASPTVAAAARPAASALGGPPAQPAQRVGYLLHHAQAGEAWAQYALGIVYAKGQGVPQDYEAAALWFRKAAKQGIVPAMIDTALSYERGQGGEISRADAYAWYRAAARRGNAFAAGKAAALFKQFTGVEKGRAVMRAAALVDVLHKPHVATATKLMPGDWIAGSHKPAFAQLSPPALAPGIPVGQPYFSRQTPIRDVYEGSRRALK